MASRTKSKKVTTIEGLATLMAGEFGDVRREIGGLRTEVGDLRTEMRQGFNRVDEELHAIRVEVVSIRKEIDALQEKTMGMVGYSKEIDHLLTRVARIEKHLGITSNKY